MTGGLFHDPVMVATAQGVPVGRCGVDLVNETFFVRAPSERARPLEFIL